MHILGSPFSLSCIVLLIASLSVIDQVIDHSFPNAANLYIFE